MTGHQFLAQFAAYWIVLSVVGVNNMQSLLAIPLPSGTTAAGDILLHFILVWVLPALIIQFV